ncbi:hypothetical protein L9F63_026370, partial [Diploptera punctata]
HPSTGNFFLAIFFLMFLLDVISFIWYIFLLQSDAINLIKMRSTIKFHSEFHSLFIVRSDIMQKIISIMIFPFLLISGHFILRSLIKRNVGTLTIQDVIAKYYTVMQYILLLVILIQMEIFDFLLKQPWNQTPLYFKNDYFNIFFHFIELREDVAAILILKNIVFQCSQRRI